MQTGKMKECFAQKNVQREMRGAEGRAPCYHSTVSGKKSKGWEDKKKERGRGYK